MQIIFFAKIDVKKLHLLIGFWNLQKGMTISQKGIIAKKKIREKLDFSTMKWNDAMIL